MVQVSFRPPPSRRMAFQVDTRVTQSVASVQPRGELDLASAPLLEEALIRAEGTSVSAIELDLSEITFIDSSGLRLLLRAAARSRADSNRLRIIGPTRQVRRLVTLVGVADCLPLEAEPAPGGVDGHPPSAAPAVP